MQKRVLFIICFLIFVMCGLKVSRIPSHSFLTMPLLLLQIHPILLITNTHKVSVAADSNVDNTIILELRTSSLLIFFAIIYPVTVAGEPSITIIATSASFLKPSFSANGRKTSGKPINFIKVATQVGAIFLIACFPLNVAPTTKSAIGVAVCAIKETVLVAICGSSIPQIENGKPKKIPQIIGFLAMLISAFFIAPFLFAISEELKLKIITEYMLYNGIDDTIISGPMPELP